MKTNFTKNLKGSTRIMDLIFILAIAIAHGFVKHIDRKYRTIIIIISGVYVTLSVKACLAHYIRQLVNAIITLFGKC